MLMPPPESEDLVARRIAERAGGLTPAMSRVAAFFGANRVAALTHSAAEVAAQAKTSDATVVRTARALGFDGLNGLRDAIAQSMHGAPTPAANMVQTMAEVGDDIDRATELVLSTHAEGLDQLRQPGSQGRLRAAIALLRPASRIVLFGIGQTAPLVAYGAHMLRRGGRKVAQCDASGIALADQMLDLAPGDALLLIAYGDAYPEIEAILGEAAAQKLPTVLLTDSLDERLARHANVVVPASRGRAHRVALHAVTMAALEALVVALAVADPTTTMQALTRLGALRSQLGGKPSAPRSKVGDRRGKAGLDRGEP